MQDLNQHESTVRGFFAYARERQRILLDRRAGYQPPWSADPILRKYKFTNIFREDDRVTLWFKHNVRDRLQDSDHIMLATVVFRWFNRISTGQAIFCQYGNCPELGMSNVTPWDVLINAIYSEDSDHLVMAIDHMRSSIKAFCGNGPYVTGAYIIQATHGMNKLDGVLDCIYKFITTSFTIYTDKEWDWLSLTQFGRRYPLCLEDVWTWLKKHDFLGGFMSYEVVTDLANTPLLENAKDKMTWAHPGPGATRGLRRILLGAKDAPGITKPDMLNAMRRILALSRDNDLWPQEWGEWTMREVEHTLCEFDKYERARLGEGTPRGVYRHGS